MAALQAYAGLVACLLSAAVTARVKGRLADQLGRLADVATEVTAGQPLPASRRNLTRARAAQANDHQPTI